MALLFPAGYQFHDTNGHPVASGEVYFYSTGTESLKAVYTDKDLTISAANPFSLDASGRFTGSVNIYGSGTYSIVCKDSTTATVFSRDDVYGWDSAPLSGSKTHDFGSLADGAGETTTVTVTGAALGDFVEGVSLSVDLQGMTLTGYVSAADTVSVRLQNESGSPVDLSSATLRARVRKS
jgi:hypothetical protein